MTGAGFNGGGSVRVCDSGTSCDGGFQDETNVAGDGTYAILVPNGSYQLTFWSDGGSAQIPFPSVVTVNGATVVADLQVTLRSIKGTVTATGGIPLEGAYALAYSEANVYVTATITAADGTYTIWIAPGVYKVTFNAYTLPSIWYPNASDFTGGTAVDVSAADAVRIDATFPAVTISGTISGAAGGGVAADVFVIDASCVSQTQRGSGRSSSPDGSYAVWVPNTGAYHVYATLPFASTYYVQGSPSGTVDCQGATTLILSGQAVTGIDIAVPAYRIGGTVWDSQGGAIANALVGVSGTSSSDLMYTGADGTYALTVLSGDTVTVFVTPPPQYASAQAGPFLVGTSNILQDLTLASAHLVSGKVLRSADSAPLAFATVYFHLGGGATCCSYTGYALTDAAGHFDVWLVNGTYRASAAATGYTTTWWPNATSFDTATDIVVSDADKVLTPIALP